MSVRVFVTGGTFDKEYDELTGTLHFGTSVQAQGLKGTFYDNPVSANLGPSAEGNDQLDVALRWRKMILLLAAATFAATGWMFYVIPKGFFPQEDIGQIQVSTEAAEDVSFEQMVQLQDRVARLAGAMAARGVTKGDRVIIYMPMVPEAAIGMLACARLGAPHSVIFGGFSAEG